MKKKHKYFQDEISFSCFYHPLIISGDFVVVIPYMHTQHLSKFTSSVLFPFLLSFSLPFQWLVGFVTLSPYGYMQCTFILFQDKYLLRTILFFFHSFVHFLLWLKKCNIKFTVLIIFKYTIKYDSLCLHCSIEQYSSMNEFWIALVISSQFSGH
jgi:hypothetical protein